MAQSEAEKFLRDQYFAASRPAKATLDFLPFFSPVHPEKHIKYSCFRAAFKIMDSPFHPFLPDSRSSLKIEHSKNVERGNSERKDPDQRAPELSMTKVYKKEKNCTREITSFYGKNKKIFVKSRSWFYSYVTVQKLFESVK